jgi:UDP-galactopyranose mutase
MAQTRPLVYLAPNRWDGIKQRPQHLCQGLARTRPVIFVEPPAHSLPGAAKQMLRADRTAVWKARTRRVGDEQLFVVTPQPSIPFSLHGNALNAFVHELTRYQLLPLLRTLNADAIDIIVGVPPAISLARRLPRRTIIYDCLDYFPAFFQGRRARLMEIWEDELCREADDVVVASAWMYDRWRERHPRVHRIPNGVELDRFSFMPEQPTEPADIAALPHPRFGYTGSLARWIDFPLLVEVAESCPTYSFILIGPLLDGSKPENLPANLHWLGERPYEDIPRYLSAMDVLLIPFKLMDLTRAVNPVKLYEYAAIGKPIIGTPIPDVIEASSICHTAADAKSFIEIAKRTLVGMTEEERSKLSELSRRFAQEHSWNQRVEAFNAILNQKDLTTR